MHSRTPGHLTPVITTRLEVCLALTKPAKVYEPQNREQRSQEQWGEADTVNVGNSATVPPSGNETLTLSGYLFLGHPSTGLTPSSVGHLLCSSRGDLSLSNYSPTKY